MTTIRQHLEAIRDTPDLIAYNENAWKHAIKGLEILDKMEPLIAGLLAINGSQPMRSVLRFPPEHVRTFQAVQNEPKTPKG